MKLVSIIIATYKPNKVFFQKLLESLNNQDYPKIELIVRDDSEDEIYFNIINDMLNEYITNFSFVLKSNTFNLGSNKTFELLTQEANGEYISYCDQDDIWELNKISKLVNIIEKENSILCYSDLSVIDDTDKSTANSFKDMNKRVNHMYGENLFKYFLRRNSVTGCTMLIKSKIAKEAIPFCHEYYVHDHWLTLWASMRGKLSYINEPLIQYRIHENNQIGASMLHGIENRDDYLNQRLRKEKNKYRYLLNNYTFDDIQQKEIMELYKWTQYRIDFFEHKNLVTFSRIIRGFKYDWQLNTLEIFINLFPSNIVKRTLKLVRN